MRAALVLLAALPLLAIQQQGQVEFNGFPVPGATVTAVRGGQKQVALTNAAGVYSLDLAAGKWTVAVAMAGFAPLHRDIDVAPGAPAARWDLKLLSLAEIHAAAASPALQVNAPVAPPPETAPAHPDKPKPAAAETDERAADGLLINGSVNNGAASPFAQFAAFGNHRRSGRGLYTGGLGLIFDNSALDARSYSLTGQNTPKPSYNRVTGIATLGGPLRIPHLFKYGPNFFVGYQWTRNRDANTEAALMPTPAQRNGEFQQPITDPSTGQPFPGNVVPLNRIRPEARTLLGLYPLPNFAGANYNYQVPVVSATHQDAMQSRLSQNIGPRNQVYGGLAFQSSRADNPSLFGFLDTAGSLGLLANANWSHRFGQRTFLNLGMQFSRYASRATPYFANRENISEEAHITGNNQDPINWGPPALSFSSGIASLSDGLPSFTRNQTTGISGSMLWSRPRHNITVGADLRRQQFNSLSQQDPRGTFTFTGAAAGSDFAGFLLGVPDTASVAFGNADKYFRDSVYDAYVNDDWRVSPQLTINAGLRWEYGSPITELYGRLVNLDVAPGFSAVAPVLANSGQSPLTGASYPNSLVRPDRSGLEPRLGIAWRPIGGSSLVVRAGYGIYYNTSVYQGLAIQMAQQPPLSKTLRVQNSPQTPLTLGRGFNANPSGTPNTYAVDPDFRVGYAQNWNLSLQRDLPGSLQLTAAYLGVKGTRGLQEFLPNTYPAGPIGPAGYVYLVSNGNSTRQAGQVQLRRRLHNGFTATLTYTYSKSIDNDAVLGGAGGYNVQNSPGPGSGAPTMVLGAPASAPGSAMIAQNWLDLAAERSLSSFDQRHLLSLQAQYTTGMGIGGGTLLSGWRSTLFKDWTVATQITAGSGLPETPVYMAPVAGTGVTGTLRPQYTGEPLYAAPPGRALNPAAFATPPAGQWGNAGRNSITGPSQFSLDASLGRIFRLNDRLNLDLRLDATNALNHVTFTSWNTVFAAAQFGLPAAANNMRSVQTTLRLRF